MVLSNDHAIFKSMKKYLYMWILHQHYTNAHIQLI